MTTKPVNKEGSIGLPSKEDQSRIPASLEQAWASIKLDNPHDDPNEFPQSTERWDGLDEPR